MGNGPEVDNPAFIGPAGTVHCTLGDWAKFVADQLRGARGGSGLLRPETSRRLHTPPFGGVAALGWGAREMDGVTVLSHSGSNGWNVAVIWIAPLRNIATLVVTNQGGEAANTAANEASTALRELHAGKDENLRAALAGIAAGCLLCRAGSTGDGIRAPRRHAARLGVALRSV